jgi:hypothetical protein
VESGSYSHLHTKNFSTYVRPPAFSLQKYTPDAKPETSTRRESSPPEWKSAMDAATSPYEFVTVIV